MLSKASKYAIRALVYMSTIENNPLMNIHQIADKLDIPEQFLGKILQLLAKRKVLYSQKGINGGFKFLKQPSEITFLEVVEIIDGLESFDNCLLGMKFCKLNPEVANQCYFHDKLDPLLLQLKNILSETTIENYISNLEKINKILF